MTPQSTPLYATVWYPGASTAEDVIDDAPYLVIGWTGFLAGHEDVPGFPVIVKLGGHNGPPMVWAYPVEDGDPTLDFADSLADALATIAGYPEGRRV